MSGKKHHHWSVQCLFTVLIYDCIAFWVNVKESLIKLHRKQKTFLEHQSLKSIGISIKEI